MMDGEIWSTLINLSPVMTTQSQYVATQAQGVATQQI